MTDPMATTTQKAIPTNPYKPTEIRLYGHPCESIDAESFTVTVTATPKGSGEHVDKLVAALQRIIHGVAVWIAKEKPDYIGRVPDTDEKKQLQKVVKSEMSADDVLKDIHESILGIAVLQIQAERSDGLKPEVAVVYGYSYEGHCYSLPRPMILAVDNTTRKLADGCGYGTEYKIEDDSERPVASQSGPTSIRYRMWTADKLDKTLELSLRQDFYEQIVLTQNTGDQREPIAYSAKARLAHRGGKLVD